LLDLFHHYIAFIFMLKQSKKTLLVQLDHTDEGTTLPRNVCNHLPGDTTLHQTRLEA